MTYQTSSASACIIFSFTKSFISSCIGPVIQSFLSYLSSSQNLRQSLLTREYSQSTTATDKDHVRFLLLTSFSIKFFLGLSDLEQKDLGAISAILSGIVGSNDLSNYLLKRFISYSSEKNYVLMHSVVDCLSSYLFLLEFVIYGKLGKRLIGDNADKSFHFLTTSADSILTNFFYDMERLNSLIILSKSMSSYQSPG